jgi:hypothetical protein
VATGNCAAFGGLPAAQPNPTGARSLSEVLAGKPVLNIPGCPAIPEVTAGSIVAPLLHSAEALNACEPPGATVAVLGLMANDDRLAMTTCAVSANGVTPPQAQLAMMEKVPASWPAVNNPLLLMVPAPALETLYVTVAARVASAVLADKRIDAVEVTIHKPQAPIETAFSDVSVTIRRTAADLA